MKIEFLSLVVPRPCALPEKTDPIIWRPSMWCVFLVRISGMPNVEVLPTRLPVRRPLKPNRLVARMVRHEIEENFHIQLVGALNQTIEIGQRTVLWLNVVVVGDVVAEVSHRWFEYRWQPRCRYADFFQIFQILRDALWGERNSQRVISENGLHSPFKSPTPSLFVSLNERG